MIASLPAVGVIIVSSLHRFLRAMLLFHLIGETDLKSSTVSEPIRDKNGTVIMEPK